MKKLTIEIFDKKGLKQSIDTGDGDHDDYIPPDEPSGECDGVKHFTNEGIVEVEHTCNSIYLDITVYNSNKTEIGAVKKIINNNKFTVTMTPSIDGYVVWEKIR